MIEWFCNVSHVYQALIATIFTWGITALGSSLVFFIKKVNKTFIDGMLGFAAGVMLASSIWSLIVPGLELANELKMNGILISSLGILSGGLLLFIGDNIYNNGNASKDKNSKFNIMLILSITLHNIPEGLVVGIAFGSLKYGLVGMTISSAIALAIGIGLQNFPEGSAISIPLRRSGMSRWKAFYYGQMTGLVEPIAGVIGAILVLKIKLLLPFLLCFAAGSMIYVIIEELVPESQTNSKKDVMALFTLLGFITMLILDIAL